LVASQAFAIPITPDTFEDGTTMEWFMPDAIAVLPPELRTGHAPDDMSVAQVSEPATMLLVSTGCAALFAYRRHRMARGRCNADRR
jgi:hypothetical protein